MILQYFSRQIYFSRTVQDSPVYSSTFPACANPERLARMFRNFPSSKWSHFAFQKVNDQGSDHDQTADVQARLPLYCWHSINTGSYMSTLVLLNLLNELGKEINARLAEHFIVFSQQV